MFKLRLLMYLPINTLHNHMYNLSNKEKMSMLNGYKKKIKLLIIHHWLKKLSINKEVELKLLMYLVMFITNKTLFNLQLIEKKFKLNLIKVQHKKLLLMLLMKVLNILNLKVLEELLYHIQYKKKFQLVYQNQLFMMYLFINMNMYLLMNHVIHVVVMIKIMLQLVFHISLILQKLKLIKMVENILMVIYKEVVNKDKLKKKLLLKMLLNIMVNFMVKIHSLVIMVWVLLLVFMKMKMIIIEN